MGIFGNTISERQPKFKIKKTKDGQYCFDLIAKNGEIILQSESYKSKSGCENCIKSIIENAPKAKIVDITDK